jgi:drug/metabolite transporter (DMT)-like permease
VLGIVCLLGASVSWAYGSIWSRTASRPASPFLTVGMQMAAGGLALTLVGALRGELVSFDVSAISTRSVLAWVHLLVAGALIGFTAYVWLLQVSTPARVSTYAYVNPVIAVLLGVWLGKEPLAANTLTGAVLVVLSVIIILRAPARSRAQKSLATPRITSPASAQPTLGK